MTRENKNDRPTGPVPLSFGGRGYRIRHPKPGETAEQPKRSLLFAIFKWISIAIGIALAIAVVALLFVIPKGPLP